MIIRKLLNKKCVQRMFVTSKVLANIDNIEPNVESLCFKN